MFVRQGYNLHGHWILGFGTILGVLGIDTILGLKVVTAAEAEGIINLS